MVIEEPRLLGNRFIGHDQPFMAYADCGSGAETDMGSFGEIGLGSEVDRRRGRPAANLRNVDGRFLEPRLSHGHAEKALSRLAEATKCFAAVLNV